MSRPSSSAVRKRLEASFALDDLWRETMGLRAGDSKESALRELTRVLAATKTPYAVIGGIAVQLYTAEPRTTLDIDIALVRYSDIPAEALTAAGFQRERGFAHSENWRAPGPLPRKQRCAIQFSVDTLTPGAVLRAKTHRVRSLKLKVVSLPDLVRLKLEAAEEPRRRASKRQSDVGDVIRLLEEHPELSTDVPDARQRIVGVLQGISAGLLSGS